MPFLFFLALKIEIINSYLECYITYMDDFLQKYIWSFRRPLFRAGFFVFRA
jgi:hypothetical protein